MQLDLNDTESLIAIAIGAIALMTTIWLKIIRPLSLSVRNSSRNLSLIPSILESMKSRDGLFASITDLMRNVKDIQSSIAGVEYQQELQSQHQECLMDILNLGTFRANPNGNITYCSPVLCRIMDRSEQELSGNNWLTWVHEQDRGSVQHQWKSARESARAFEQQFRFVCSDGTMVFVRMRAFPVPRNVDVNQISFYFGSIEVINHEDKIQG